MSTPSEMNPGDEAREGTASSGKVPCDHCDGTGKHGDEDCPVCGGTGEVIEAVGGG